MIRFYKLVGVLGLLVFIIGCSDEDPLLPLPELNFTTDPEIVEVGVEVTFQNLTLNASSYSWDFGDGQTSTAISPKITYEESGSYTVTLVAFTDDNQSDSLSREIDVGERVMTDLIINSISFVNTDGEDWDDPTGLPDSTKYPDFVLFLGPEDDFERMTSTYPPIVDLAPFELPIVFSLDPGGDPFVLTNEDWVLEMYDFDGADIENPQNEDFEVMEGATFNPVTLSTSAVREDGTGFIQIAFGQYAIDIRFEIQ
jgi:PKD repeat protein